MNSALLIPDYTSDNTFFRGPDNLSIPCVINSTTDSDLSDIRTYYNRLSQESRQMRLHLQTSTIPQNVLRLYEGRNPNTVTGLVARNLNNDVVGEAILANDSSDDCAHIGISVCDTKRGCGIGTKIMSELVDRARKYGCQILHADTLRTNKSFIAFAEALGFHRTRHPDDWHQIRLSLNLDQYT